jgi:thiamine pyrophosphokinase
MDAAPPLVPNPVVPKPVVVVFAGGDPLPASVLERIPSDALVIAADSGVEHALALGCRVDLIVGDLDSAAPAAIDRAVTAGAEVEHHPAEKNATDLELALVAARARDASHILVVGGAGGRLDHFLANALALAGPGAGDTTIEWITTEGIVTVVRATASLIGRPGDLVSLLAMGGPAAGVRTTGLRYPLDREELLPGSTRGVSNEFTGTTAGVSVGRGTLLAIQPRGEERT